jgi:hypothetical protein
MAAQTEKQAGPTAEDFQKMWGDRILRTGIGGAGLGAGAASLYYLARNLSAALKQRQEAAAVPPAPTMPESDEDAEKTSGLYDDITKGVGKTLPDSFLRMVDRLIRPSGATNDFDPNVARSTFGTLGALGAGGAGVYGGWQAVKAINDSKKQRDRKQLVEDAEREYYDALTGPNNKLDAVYAKAAEKAAAEKVALLDAITGMWDAAKRLPAAGAIAYTGAGLGLGGLAAKLLYDRAQSLSKAKAVEEAAKSRERISGILPAYVDPDELAAVKNRVAEAQPSE